MRSATKVIMITLLLITVSAVSITMASETTKDDGRPWNNFSDVLTGRNIYYIYSYHKGAKIWHLDDYSSVGGGSNQFNMANLNSSFDSSSSAMTFWFPWHHENTEYPGWEDGLTSNFNANIIPTLNLTINTNYVDNKEIHMELRFDTDGNGDWDTRAQFGTFITQQPGGLTEEYINFESTGYTNGAPGNMNGGYIQLALWRTDGITDNPNTAMDEDWCTIYGGAFNKTSRAILPYEWQIVNPVAVIEPDPDQDGSDWWVDPAFATNPVHRNGFLTNESVHLSAINSTSPVGAEIQTAAWIIWSDTDGDGWYQYDHEVASLNGVNVNHSFDSPGIFWIEMNVWDENGRSGWTSHWINVSQNPGSDPYVENFLVSNNPALVHTPVDFTIHADDDRHATIYNAPILYQWDFDGDDVWDTNASREFHTLQHTYDIPGTYDVAVKIFDGPVNNKWTRNITYVYELWIKNNEGPIINFNVSSEFDDAQYPADNDILVMIGDDIVFDFSGTDDPDNLPGVDNDHELKIEIDFGDNSGTQVNRSLNAVFTHRYTTGGPNNMYEIHIIITDGDITENIMFYAHIDVPPIASAGATEKMGTQVFGEGELTTDDIIVFDGSRSYDPNDDTNGNETIDGGEGDNCIYNWDFGDNSTSGSQNQPNASHSYDEPGTYTATITVTDPRGQSDKDTIIVYVLVPNKIPVAAITIADEKSSYDSLEEIKFSSEYSYDPDNETGGDIIRYNWDFGDGARSTDTNPSHSFSKPGTYDVTLLVEDDRRDQSDLVIKTIIINNLVPTAKLITPSIDKDQYKLKQFYVFTGDGTDLDGNVTQYKWSIDGEVIQDWGNETELNYTFTKYGEHVISLWVKDDKGMESNADNYTLEVKKKSKPKSPGFTSTLVAVAVISGIIVVAISNRKRR